MSDQPYALPPVPLMTPERAVLVARNYKALAENLANLVPGDAARAERQSQWWLNYSIALAATNPEQSDG